MTSKVDQIDMTITAMRIATADHLALQEAASGDHRSVSALMRRMIRTHPRDSGNCTGRPTLRGFMLLQVSPAARKAIRAEAL